MFGTFRRALGDRPLTVWDFEGDRVLSIEGIQAVDIVGDGSLYDGSTPSPRAPTRWITRRTPPAWRR